MSDPQPSEFSSAVTQVIGPTTPPTMLPQFADLFSQLSMTATMPGLSFDINFNGCVLHVGPGLDGRVSKNFGFLGDEASQQPLPMAMNLLEQVHEKLPVLLRRGTVREAINSLPPLQDQLNDLEQKHTARVALLLSTLAHAYHFASSNAVKVPLSPYMENAWAEICRRLERPLTGRVVADELLNNFQPRHEGLDYHLTSSPLDLMEEVTTLGVQGTMEYIFAPALSLMAEAQTSLVAHNDTGVAVRLERISTIIRKCMSEFVNITPQAAPQGFDPIIWSQSFLAMGRATREGELSNSGEDTLLFHALDCFLGQEARQTGLEGAQKDRRKTLPQNIQMLLMALESPSVSLRRYIQESSNARLKAAFRATLQLYSRLLEWHRVKAVGITGVILGTGKHETSTGIKSNVDSFTDTSIPTPTEMLNQQMLAGLESRMGTWSPYQAATVTDVSVGEHANSIVLSFETALPIEAGDRIQILPRNSQEEAQKAASLLEEAFGQGSVQPDHLDKLAYLDLEGRGLDPTSKSLSIDSVLHEMQEHKPRFYSIGKAFPNGDDLSTEMRLTVGHGHGVSAKFMTSLRKGDTIRATLHPCPRFNAPQDPSVPLILIGQGSGIGPLVGFLHARARLCERPTHAGNNSAPVIGPVEFYIACGRQKHVNFLSELVALSKSIPRLSITVALSDEANLTAQSDCENIRMRTDKITHLLQEDITTLQKLMAEHSAHVFVCGSTDFGIDVRNALGKAPKNKASGVSRKFTAPAPTDWRYYHEDLFGTREGPPKRKITPAELAEHNAFDDCWTALEGVVYDFTDYLSLHPGGSKTLMESAGTRCDIRFHETHGQQLQEIFGRLKAYAIGRLDDSEQETQKMKALEAVVRTQNTLTNNTAFPADRQVPFYVYCDALLIHTGQSLRALGHVLKIAGMSNLVGSIQDGSGSKYEDLRARCWQELQSTIGTVQLESKEADFRKVYLEETMSLHHRLEEIKMSCV